MPPPTQRYPYLYEGECTRRDDPDGLGRIRIRIPGMVEPETPQWVEPIGGTSGGHAQRGEFDPPPVGANVAVMFVLGDPDSPRYLVGPWGDPGGVSDVPTGGVVEGADKQRAAREDAEWLIQRDSRSGSHKYLVRHKSSSVAILIDGTADRVYLVRESATEQLVLGTAYRAAEVTALGQLVAAIDSIVAAVNSTGADATFSAAFPTAAGFLTALSATVYPPLKAAFTGSQYASDATDYLSDKARTE
jgi:hypothetical protein